MDEFNDYKHCDSRVPDAAAVTEPVPAVRPVGDVRDHCRPRLPTDEQTDRLRPCSPTALT